MLLVVYCNPVVRASLGICRARSSVEDGEALCCAWTDFTIWTTLHQSPASLGEKGALCGLCKFVRFHASVLKHVSLEIELSFSLHRPHINSYYPNIALLWLFRCWGQLPNVWWNECCPAGSDRVRYVTPRVRHVRHEATLFGTDHYIPQHLMSLMRAQCSNWRLVSSPLQTRDRDRGFWCWSRGSRPPTLLHRNLDSGLASAPIRQPIKLSCMQLAGRLTSSAQK